MAKITTPTALVSAMLTSARGDYRFEPPAVGVLQDRVMVMSHLPLLKSPLPTAAFGCSHWRVGGLPGRAGATRRATTAPMGSKWALNTSRWVSTPTATTKQPAPARWLRWRPHEHQPRSPRHAQSSKHQHGRRRARCICYQALHGTGWHAAGHTHPGKALRRDHC